MPPTMHAFDFILVLFSFVFVCRDLIASRRRQHIVFGPTETEADVRRDEQDREARRVGGHVLLAKPSRAHLSLKAVAADGRPRGVAPCSRKHSELRGHFHGFVFFTADFLAPSFALLPLPIQTRSIAVLTNWSLCKV